MASGKPPHLPFTVTGRRCNGTVTYLCRDADWALRTRAHFERMGYEGIAMTGPNGAPVEVAELERVVRGVGRRTLADA